MRLWKRLKFVWRFDIDPYFIVVPFGDTYNVVRFEKYEDAIAFTKEQQREKPMFPRPELLVIVRKTGDKL